MDVFKKKEKRKLFPLKKIFGNENSSNESKLEKTFITQCYGGN